MFGYRARGFASLVAGGQCVAIWFVPIVAAHFSGAIAGMLALGTGAMLWPWMLGIVGEALWRHGVEKDSQAPGFGACCVRTIAAAILACIAGGEHFADQQHPAATVALWAGVLALLVGTHWTMPRLLTKILFYDQHIHRTLIVGAASKVADLARVLSLHRPLGIHAVGWLAEEPDALDLFEDAGLPQLGLALNLQEVVRQEAVDQVIVAGTPPDMQVALWKKECERLGVRLVVANSLALAHPGHFRWEAKGDWCFGVAYAEPLQSPVYRLLKRSLDIVVALPALMFVVLPFALITRFKQRRESPGPLFYRQWRHGRSNRPFQVWKFRTMHASSAITVPAGVQAQRADSRIFPFGSWLRRHSLDELPQFLNVLTGEMSVVGPRPHFVEHTDIFAVQEQYHMRSFVKPGITGLAQVNGCRGEVRSPEDIEHRVLWDIRYVQQWTLLMDVWLIIRTAGQVFYPPGQAY